VERKWWVLIAVGIGTFMTALDGSVVNIVLPIVSKDFGADIATIEWVVTIYLLVVSGLLLSFGRLGDLRGHKDVYVSGFLIFVVGSVICGVAPNELVLIAARAMQATGGAMLASNSPAIITRNFPMGQRGQALGLQGTMTYLGLTVGPSLGGWLTSQFGWRSVFYINVPVGALAILLSTQIIPRDEPDVKQEQFDLRGAALFMVGLILFLLGLNQGNEWGWASFTLISCIALSLVLLAAFVVHELREPHPMLDLTLFQRRIFSAAVASAVANYICAYSVLFLMPFFLIQGRGLGPAQAGLLLTAQPLIMAISAPLSGTLSDRIGSRVLGTFGMIVFAFGLWLLSRLGPVSSQLEIVTSLAIVGLGTGIFTPPNNSALMGSAPRHQQGVAAGTLATARSVGMVLGVGLAGAIFTTVHETGTIFDAISAGYFVAVFVALIGAGLSAVRGSTQPIKMGSQ
jgi:EmrB/QacA subfamily drug resistance transporter